MSKHIILDQNKILIHKTMIHDHKIRWFNIENNIYINCSDLVNARMVGKKFSNKFSSSSCDLYRIYIIIQKTCDNYVSKLRYIHIDDIISHVNFEGTIWKYIKQIKRR